jgi:hypothetical protein
MLLRGLKKSVVSKSAPFLALYLLGYRIGRDYLFHLRYLVGNDKYLSTSWGFVSKHST